MTQNDKTSQEIARRLVAAHPQSAPCMSAQDEAELSGIVEQVVKRLHPQKIILYGSFAYGHPHEESDFDVLTVMQTPSSRKENWAIIEEIRGKRELQLVSMGEVEYEETREVVGGLAYPAHQWGKVLWRSAEKTAQLVGESQDSGIRRSKDQVIWDFVQEKLRIAEKRLVMSQQILDFEKNYGYHALFHAHQAAAYVALAFLIRYQTYYPSYRRLPVLAALISVEENILRAALEKVCWLDRFGIDATDLLPPDVDDATVRSGLKDVREWAEVVKTHLGSYLAQGRPE
jgi:HEPN domain-containing protein/predicted nucleotidyltransferase